MAITASSTPSGDAALLIDGMSRNSDGEVHHWMSDGLSSYVQLDWPEPVRLSKTEIKRDANLKRNILMRKDSRVNETFRNDVPDELLKSIHVEVLVDGKWVRVASTDRNRSRLVRFVFDPIKTTSIRVFPTATYGCLNAKLFEIRCYED